MTRLMETCCCSARIDVDAYRVGRLEEFRTAHAVCREQRSEIEALRRQRNDLDRLVSEFCVAAGEPIPVDAISAVKALVAASQEEHELQEGR